MGMSFIKQLEPAEDLELIVNESRERLLQLCDGEVEIADITEEDDMSFFAPTPNAS